MSWHSAIWNSAGEFFAMGGYAPYVWGSVAVAAASIAAEVITVRLRHKAIRAQIALRHRTVERNAGAGGDKA